MGRKKLGVFDKALRDAAAELGQPIDSWHVEKLATLTLMLKVERAKWANNSQHSDGTSMVSLMNEITTMRQAAGLLAPRNLDLHIVEAQDEQECPACKYKFTLATTRRTLEEAQRAAREREASEPQPLQSVPPRPRSVVDLVPGAGSIRDGRPPAPVAVARHDPGSIHTAVALVPDGNGGVVKTYPPLKRWQGDDVRRYAAGDPNAPFSDPQTISQKMRQIDRSYT